MSIKRFFLTDAEEYREFMKWKQNPNYKHGIGGDYSGLPNERIKEIPQRATNRYYSEENANKSQFIPKSPSPYFDSDRASWTSVEQEGSKGVKGGKREFWPDFGGTRNGDSVSLPSSNKETYLTASGEPNFLNLLPNKIRKNSKTIMMHLGQVPNSIFRLLPGTMQIMIKEQLVHGSNFIELLSHLHSNLPNRSKISVGLWLLMEILANYTALPATTIQSKAMRQVFTKIRDGQFKD